MLISTSVELTILSSEPLSSVFAITISTCPASRVLFISSDRVASTFSRLRPAMAHLNWPCSYNAESFDCAALA